jgi:hypothetical protein
MFEPVLNELCNSSDIKLVAKAAGILVVLGKLRGTYHYLFIFFCL